MGLFRKNPPVLRVYRDPIAEGLTLGYAKPGDVGMDVACAEAVVVPANGYAQARTGLRFKIPKGYYLHVYGKGGSAILGLGFDLCLVDEEFTGELALVCWNKSDTPVHVPRGKCIAQVVLRRYERAEIRAISLEEMDSHVTERGGGRLGSTGRGI